MRANERGVGPASDLLDKLFGNKKQTISLALAVAAVGYVLSLLFGDSSAAEDAFYRPVVTGIVVFVGLYLVMVSQLKNPLCTASFMNFMELFFAICSAAGLVIWLVMYGIENLFSPDAYETATMIAEVSGLRRPLPDVPR